MNPLQILSCVLGSLVIVPLALGDTTHSPGDILYKRTDGLNVGAPNDQFTGALPDNSDLAAPFGEPDDPDTFIVPVIDVEAEPGTPPINLIGDNFDLAFTFQFYDDDGVFSFTENFDDRVQVTITPIVGSTDLTATGAPATHSDGGWNVRTFADYDFGAAGWFDAQVLMTEDGGGAQSAGGIGFGYSNAASTGIDTDFGLIGAVAGATFDTDGAGESLGSMLVRGDDPGDPTDTDGDNIPDSYEEQFFPGDLTQLGPGDFDNDGVNDPDEFTDGTNPTEPDTDMDGSSDGDEKANGTDPLDDDSDDDGLLDGVETNTGIFTDANDTGTDPLNPDSDGDNFSDGAEVAGNTDPNDANSRPRPPPASAGKLHVPGWVLYRRTDGLNVGGDEFTGALPENLDLEEPFDELDDPLTLVVTELNVDAEPGVAPISLTGDNFDLAFTFQFYDADGKFSFTENFDDRVQITITPIVSARDATATGAPASHSDVAWNVRTFADFNFASAGWFDAQILMVEDGGGAQSAGGIGFGFSKAASAANVGDYGLIGAGAVFDKDAVGEDFGSLICTPGNDLNPLALAVFLETPDPLTLRAEFNTVPGMRYDIVVSPDLSTPRNTWAPLAGFQDLPADPSGRASVVFPAPFPDEGYLAVVQEPVPPEGFFFDDLEGGIGTWTTTVNGPNNNTNWELGVPQVFAPVAAHSGTMCFGTNIASDYDFDADISLRSPDIDLTGAAQAVLNYFRFVDTEEIFDFGTLSVYNATTDALIRELENPIEGGPSFDWEEIHINLPAGAAGNVVYFVWTFVSDPIANFGGIYIDTISVTGPPN